MAIIFPNGSSGSGGSGTVTSVASADTSIAVTNPTTTPSLKLATLDVIAANELAAADVTLNSHKLTNVTDPASAQDAATKNYVDTAIQGLDWRQATLYATTGALPANVYANGASGVGATLTGSAVGALNIDGSTPSVGDRVLVKNEVTGSHNGVYTVTVVGGVATLYVLTRATDYNRASEMAAGDAFYVISGTTNTDTSWVMTTTGVITVGTTTLTFVQFGGQLVSSVFGRTGAVVAASNDYTLNQVGAATADYSLNTHKLTGLANGSAPGDAATWDETPTGLVTAKGDLVLGTGSHSVSRLGVGANGHVLTANSAATDGVDWEAVPLSTFQGNGNGNQVPKGSGNWLNMPDVQVFAAGAGQTWTKPADIQFVEVVCIGSGGQGGGGTSGTGATSSSGGGGGGGGAVSRAVLQTSDVGGTVTVAVGAGGSGGGTPGNNGGDGAATQFGSLLYAGGGGGGQKGVTNTNIQGGAGGSVEGTSVGANGPTFKSTAAVSGQAATAGDAGSSNGNNAESGGASGGCSGVGNNANRPGGSSIQGGPAGGAGAATSTTTAGSGSAGGATQSYVPGGGGAGGLGGSAPAAGTDGTFTGPFCGAGGGGGGGGNTGVAGKNGGKGSLGAGGGGGGAAANGGGGGTGGVGGDGRCIVISW